MRRKKTMFGFVLFITIVGLLLFQQFPVLAYDYSKGIHWDSDSCDYSYSSLNSNWRDEVNSAASTWSNAGALFTISYDSGSSNQWYDYNMWPYYTYGANTAFTYTTLEKHLTQVSTVMNTYWNFDDSGSPSANEVDVETIMLHEFGHWLHLGHSADSDATMYDPYTIGTRDVTLYFDDVLGIIDIYGN